MATTSKRQGGPVPALALEVVPGGVDDPGLLGTGHAGRRAAVVEAGALADLDEDERAFPVPVAHDEIDFAGACRGAGGDPIIAPHQREAVLLQVCQGAVLAGIARLHPVGPFVLPIIPITAIAAR